MLFDRQSRRIFPALMVVASMTVVAGCQSTMLQPVASTPKSKPLDNAKSSPANSATPKEQGKNAERTQFPIDPGQPASTPPVPQSAVPVEDASNLPTPPRTNHLDSQVVKTSTTLPVARNVLITEDPEFQSPPANTPGSATPLLDAVIRRVEQEERQMASALMAPEPEPVNPPPQPAVASVPVSVATEETKPGAKPMLPPGSIPVALAESKPVAPVEAPNSANPSLSATEIAIPAPTPDTSKTASVPAALESPPMVPVKVDPTVQKASTKGETLESESTTEPTEIRALLVPDSGISRSEPTRKSLEISDAKLCRKVVSFGSVEPLKGTSLKPGQLVVLYAELVGVDYEKKGDEFLSRTSSRLELFRVGDQDRKPIWSDTPDVVKDLCQHRRRDFYLNYLIPVPSEIAPGEYILRLSVKDLVSDLSATSEVALKVAR